MIVLTGQNGDSLSQLGDFINNSITGTRTYSDASTRTKSTVKSAVFYSPKVDLSPGISSNKYYYDVKFPRGHIALKNFNGEVVDEDGNSVPLYEAYLHHWVVVRYHQPINSTSTDDNVIVRNAGVCQGDVLSTLDLEPKLEKQKHIFQTLLE
ncbi:hypothetical protein L6164_037204 [Bauhinia variegata]|uniref:Uncharacterized protein n=1 Tax=Bauhinia variegata TaxID=167791 RepID=A0ACB9KJ73_BAUVA|nr:hypothetical protein L6164_037204 [Bauhinia variegata]